MCQKFELLDYSIEQGPRQTYKDCWKNILSYVFEMLRMANQQTLNLIVTLQYKIRTEERYATSLSLFYLHGH